MSDLGLDRNSKRGDGGQKVKLIQEWLCLQGLHVAIDGDFGPATDYAVREFQKKSGLGDDGIVGQKTFAALILPMTNALRPIASNGRPLGELVVAYAEQHLVQHPREVGGQNKGPWVRLYMDGNEGTDWAWCAGFACFMLRQACKALTMPLPIETSYSCDELAQRARRKGIFLPESDAAERSRLTTGSFFLSRKSPTDWVHTGVVMKAEKDFFHTIEGNTNDDGSREGYEVCKRTRGYGNMDFIVV